MIRMEFPRAELERYANDTDRIYALKRQVDMLVYNLQIVLDSIEEGGGSGGGSVAPDINTIWNGIRPYVLKENAKIPIGQIDEGSTRTVMTATVPNITELVDGVCCYIMNGVATSNTNWTLNVNGLGAKPVYSSMAEASRTTTVFNVAYTMLFVYNENRVEGGCWDIYYGYDSNTNTIGYQIRTNSMALPVSAVTGRYRLLFTSPDHTHYVPPTTSTSTNATSSRTVNQQKIDPFGDIIYYSYTTVLQPETNVGTAYQWKQNVLTLGYSFNRVGRALTLETHKPVYVKCTPQADGTAIIDPSEPYVQTLPTAEDGKIYIYLGVAYSATNIELVCNHPVYCYRDGEVRQWTNSTVDDDVKDTIEDSSSKLQNTYPDQNEHELYKDMVRKNLVSYLARNNFSSCITGTAINDDADGYKTVFKYKIGSCFMGLYGAGTFDYDDIETIDGVNYKVAYFDCTNFVTLITRGRAFEDSPYAYAFSHSNATIDDLYPLGLEDPDPNKNYTFDALNNVRTDNFARIMNGSGNTLQLIQRLPSDTSVEEAHLTVDEKVIDNLETGDLIFIGREGEGVTTFKGIYHVGMYVKTLTELDALATDYGITFKPQDSGDTKYGYMVEVWSVGSVSYKDKLVIHTLDYWLTTRYSGDVQYVYMCKAYANSMNSNKQYSLVTGMYRLYDDIKPVDTTTYGDGRFPATDLRMNLPMGFQPVGGRPYQLKNINIDSMNTAKYNGVWMPYNSTDLNSLSGSIPLSNTLFTLLVFGADTSGRSAKQVIVFSSKDMPNDNIIYIRQTGAGGTVFGAWKKISIS